VDIGRFLAASLPFMAHLEHITVTFDSHPLLRLDKSSESPIFLDLLDGLKRETAHGFMSVSDVSKTEVQMRAKSWSYGVSSKMASFEKRMFVWSAGVKVVLDAQSELGLGLDKAMKKAVPENCSFRLIYASLLEPSSTRAQTDPFLDG
jgi:hypothetical protein